MDLLFFARTIWWSDLCRLARGEIDFSRPTSEVLRCREGMDDVIVVKRHAACPATCRAVTTFRRASPDDRISIVRQMLWVRPHPSAWCFYAALRVFRPHSSWSLAPPPPWDLNAHWDEFPGDANQTTLHWASVHADPEVVEFLIDQGANVHAGSVYERTPLLQAVAERGREPHGMTSKGPQDANVLRVVDVLMAHGASLLDGDREGNTPLFHACSRATVQECYRLGRGLIARGADASVLNRHGWNFRERWRRCGSSHYEDDQHALVAAADACLLGVSLESAIGANTARTRL